jgi:hypothetical protein
VSKGAARRPSPSRPGDLTEGDPSRPGLQGEGRLRLRPPRILAGQAEPIFDHLPESVLRNLWNPASETALLWNLIYPAAQPHLELEALLRLRPLWGAAAQTRGQDSLRPYFWGLDLQGAPLPGLDSAASVLGEREPEAEVDLYLLGAENLVLVEAKHLSGLGRCRRYQGGRCPEIHRPWEVEGAGLAKERSGLVASPPGPPDDRRESSPCRYWEPGPANFSHALDVGPRPTPETAAPPCDRHYQLGRLLLFGIRLAQQLERTLHLWLLLPERRWLAISSDWLDFAERVKDRELWGRMRVLAWEQLRSLPGVDK